METVRLFYALWPDAATARRLAALQAPLSGRKTHVADLHLTLAFLGPQPSSLVGMLGSLPRLLDCPPMTLTLDRYGMFERKGIVWAGMSSPPPTLSVLQDVLADALEQRQVAFNREETFRPHITLARKASWPDGLEAAFEPIEWRAGGVALARSGVVPASGARYQVLACGGGGSALL